jgi:hypothetical protein
MSLPSPARRVPARAVRLAMLVGALSYGCGDDAPGTGPDAWGDHGRFADPDDFPRDRCTPGGFADVDPEAIYHLRIDWEGWGFPATIRLDRLGTSWGGLVLGRDARYASASADDLIVQWESTESDALRAVDLCARDADGTVRGTYASCPAQQTPERPCVTFPVEGRALAPLPEPAATGLTLLGELGPWPPDQRTSGITVNVRVVDDVAYLARYQDGLRIVDVSDPARPVELGHQPTELWPQWFEIWNDVKIVDGPALTPEGAPRRYALMGSSALGVVVVDVTAPRQPEIVGHFGSAPRQGEPVNVHTLFVDGGRAYITIDDLGLEIWDVADPRAPVRLGAFGHPQGGYLHDLYVAGDRAYLNFWDRGMAIVDVSDPASPALIGSFDGYGGSTSHSSWVTQIGERRIAVHGDEEWGAHVHVVDVTEGTPSFATSLAEWETRPEVSVHNVMAFGARAYLSYYQDGVRVLDLSDPAAPVAIAHFQTHPGYDRAYGHSFYEGAIGLDVDLARSRIYVADTHRGLLILQLDR